MSSDTLFTAPATPGISDPSERADVPRTVPRRRHHVERHHARGTGTAR